MPPPIKLLMFVIVIAISIKLSIKMVTGAQRTWREMLSWGLFLTMTLALRIPAMLISDGETYLLYVAVFIEIVSAWLLWFLLGLKLKAAGSSNKLKIVGMVEAVKIGLRLVMGVY